MTSGQPRPTRTLLRGLAVLEQLALHSPLRLTELVQRTGFDKATVLRLVNTLREAGYVSQQPGDRRYQLTSKVLTLSRGFVLGQDLRDCARPFLEQLRDATNETVHLGCLEGHRVVYVDKLETSRSVRLVSVVGQSMPLHSTGLGKALLAALPPKERSEMIRQLPLEARQPNTITTPEALEKEVAAIEARGFAIDDCENEENVTCVGAAIVSGEHVRGSISISAPTFRMRGQLGSYGALCAEAAAAISREMQARDAFEASGSAMAERPAPKV